MFSLLIAKNLNLKQVNYSRVETENSLERERREREIEREKEREKREKGIERKGEKGERESSGQRLSSYKYT